MLMKKQKKIEKRVKKRIRQLPTKKPRSAYAHYLATLERGEAEMGEFVRGAAKKWTQMTEQDKQSFENLANEEKQKYLKALVAWDSARESAKPKPKTKLKSTTTTTTKKPAVASKRSTATTTTKNAASASKKSTAPTTTEPTTSQ